jgi:hypothetical protein
MLFLTRASRWHVQFRMGGRDIEIQEPTFKRLPCTLIIELIAKILVPVPVPVTHPGFQALLRPGSNMSRVGSNQSCVRARP